MCEPRLGILIQGRIRNLGLSTTKGRFFSRSLPCPSDEGVARGKLPRGGGEAEHGEWPAVSVMDGIAHLGADQGLVSEIVVAGDELVPELALPGAAHDGAQVERADLVEGRRGREQRRFGVRPEDDRPGPVLPSLRRRQGDQAVPVHGQHGDPGHHVLEPAVGLEPADAPAELLRQQMAVQRRRPGGQRAQQRHFPGGEIAAVITALDLAGHRRRHELAPALLAHRPWQPRRHVIRRFAAVLRAGFEPRCPASAGRRCRSSRACPPPST